MVTRKPSKQNETPRKVRVKRRSVASPTFPEIPPVSPPIPQRYSQHQNETASAPVTPPDEDRDRTLRVVAEWRFPGDEAAQQAFQAYHRGPFDFNDPRTWILTGHHGYEEHGALVLTFEEAKRLDLMRRARRLEGAARREVEKAPPAPENPEDADSPESIEWAVSYVYAPHILDLAESAQARIAAGQWDAARSCILEAEIEVRKADDRFKMLSRRGLVKERDGLRAENEQLGRLKKRLQSNVRLATEAKSATAATRRAKVIKLAKGIRAKHPDMTNHAIARRLKSMTFHETSVRTLRRDLGASRPRTFGSTASSPS